MTKKPQRMPSAANKFRSQMINGFAGHKPSRRFIEHHVLCVHRNLSARFDRATHFGSFTLHSELLSHSDAEIPDAINKSAESSLSGSVLLMLSFACSYSGTLFRIFVKNARVGFLLMHNFLFKNNSKCTLRTCLRSSLFASTVVLVRSFKTF